jgi:transcriptional regulator with XRE-family HTH domain
MSNRTRIRCDGARVRELRVLQGMTQEKLGAMSKVNHRTVQRAERSQSLQLDTLASLAATLGVTVGELTPTDGDPDHTDQPETSESNAVVLRRITSGKTLIDLVCGSFSGKQALLRGRTDGGEYRRVDRNDRADRESVSGTARRCPGNLKNKVGQSAASADSLARRAESAYGKSTPFQRRSKCWWRVYLRLQAFPNCCELVFLK